MSVVGESFGRSWKLKGSSDHVGPIGGDPGIVGTDRCLTVGIGKSL
jgi:hypothetical protein